MTETRIKISERQALWQSYPRFWPPYHFSE